MGHSPLLQHPKAFFTELLISANVWGISCRFQQLSPSEGQVSHVLLTRSPLSPHPKIRFAFDLHVLGTPPTFILSQDQTLRIREFFLLSVVRCHAHYALSSNRQGPSLFLRASRKIPAHASLASCHYSVGKRRLGSKNRHSSQFFAVPNAFVAR